MSREQEIKTLQQTLNKAYQDLEMCNHDMIRAQEDKPVDVAAYQEKIMICLSVIKILRQKLQAYDNNEGNPSC